jgi:hypothetical protein
MGGFLEADFPQPSLRLHPIYYFRVALFRERQDATAARSKL